MKRYSLATDFESISKYFGDKNAVVISTLHGVKGEEYTTVIAAGLFIVTGQSPSLLGMDEMLQEWKGSDQFIIVKGKIDCGIIRCCDRMKKMIGCANWKFHMRC